MPDSLYFYQLENQEKIIRRSRWVLIAACLLVLLVSAVLTIVGQISFSAKVLEVENATTEKVALAKSVVAVESKKPDLSKIAKTKIFGELGSALAVVPDKPVKTVDPAADLSLVGVYLDPDEPMAIIFNKKSSEQEIFVLDQAVYEAGDMVGIYAQYVEIKTPDDQRMILKIDDSAATSDKTASGNDSGTNFNLTVDSAKVDEALDNLPLTLTQARAVPYFKNGKSVGLRLFAIKNNSLFSEIGLKNGDILKNINGSSLADITQAVKLFENLKTKKNLELSLERGRKDVTYNYTVK